MTLVISAVFRAAALSIVLSAAVLVSSCSREVTDFSFHDGAAARPLHEDPGTRAGLQGTLAVAMSAADDASSSVHATPLFTLKHPLSVTAERPDLSVSYRSTRGPLTLAVVTRSASNGDLGRSLFRLPSGATPRLPGAATAPPNAEASSAAVTGSPSTGATTATAAAAPTGTAAATAAGNSSPALQSGSEGAFTFLAPLHPGDLLVGFRIESASDNADLLVTAAAMVPDVTEVRVDASGVETVRNGFTLSVQGSTPGSSGAGAPEYRVGFAPITQSLAPPDESTERRQEQVELVYDATSYGREAGITVSGGSQSREFHLESRNGRNTVYFYTASVGFPPTGMTIDPGSSGIVPVSVRVDEVSAAPADLPTKPVPADFGTILTYAQSWWRNPKFEVFSWSLFPSVLVMDFSSLDEQSRFMKRLAFYVEKAGYAGQLWTNEQLAALHGWNAHDYRPEDLARFFSVAKSTGFQLNPEEIDLRDILVANGVIAVSGDGFVPGQGAVITIPHDAYYALRFLLLTHEGYHGIYFTHSDYRDAVHQVWGSLSDVEQGFWRLFLGQKGYDSADDYLVINEFQAYLMQQTVSDVNAYYHRSLPDLERFPEWKQLGLTTYIASHPDMFVDAAKAIQDAVEKAADVHAGDLVALRPVHL